MAFVAFMIGSGTSIELLRRYFLRRRHGMSLEEYYRRKARGESVPDI